MKPTIKKNLRAKAIKAFNVKQFGCEKVVITKTTKNGNPATSFEMHHSYGTLVQVREHKNVMIQNLEHNGQRSGMEKFIKEFIANESKKFKARKQKQKNQANSLENLCPELMNLNLA